MYIVPVRFGVATKYRMPRLADRTYHGLYISIHDKIASCMMLFDDDLVVRLMGGGSLSLFWEM